MTGNTTLSWCSAFMRIEERGTVSGSLLRHYSGFCKSLLRHPGVIYGPGIGQRTPLRQG
jgi:hypothetical protein